MKRMHYLFLVMLLAGLAGCNKEEEKPEKEKGTVHIDVGIFISENEVKNQLKSAQQTEDFKVTIFYGDGSEALTFNTVTEMPDVIELTAGEYYVEAHSDNDLPAAFENPYYYGISDLFSINSNEQQTVLVNCQLANTIVSVSYSGQTVAQFTDYSTVVSSPAGSLLYAREETRWGYFRTLPLDIAVDLTYLKPDGSPAGKSMTGSIPAPLSNRHYEIHVDASIDEGMASFQILLDESEIVVEVVEITGSSLPPPQGAIEYGELLITEIMYDPSSLSDTEGEWFEIFNASNRTLPLLNLILGRDDSNRHTISEEIDLAPGEFLVFERSDQATGSASSYTYGTDLTLTNSGAVLSLFNEGSEEVPGSLIFSVDYGLSGFPDGSGASICLDPASFNAIDAATGSSWCTSTSPYSTGDLGTPCNVNDACQ